MIDIIIPTYNTEKFILKAISSAENQTIRPHSIIVIDDGSTDNTKKIVEDYQTICTVPLIYKIKENGGPNSARNMGLVQSEATFVAFLDADDTWVKNKLEKQMVLFEKKEFSNLGLVYTGYDVINAEDVIDTTSYIVPFDMNIRGKAFVPLLCGNKILGSSSAVLIKKSVFDTVGNFDEQLRFGEDWDMWLRIAEKYDIDFIDETLVHVRRHNTNQTNALDKVFLGEIDFLNKWVSRISGIYPIPTRWADQIAFHLIIKFPKINDIQNALKKLSPLAHKSIFRKTGGSAFLYTILFCIRKLCNPKEWSHLIKKFKRYA